MSDFRNLFDFIRQLYPDKNEVHLHEPVFKGNEKAYVDECIQSTMVSSVGAFVTRFEEDLAKYVGRRYAVSTSSGTNALHLALKTLGIGPGDEVITQALTFVATANAISHTGATPVFLDVSAETLGLSPHALKTFLAAETRYEPGKGCINKRTGNRIRACLPVHVLGVPCDIEALIEICAKYDIDVVEDAAEALGSEKNGRRVGSEGKFSVFSFNGNKIVTTGGGGALLTDDQELYQNAKALATTAKTPHPWAFHHDRVAFNYRLPNINAALGCAQLESLPDFLMNKRETAECYARLFSELKIEMFKDPENSHSNHWLNAILLSDLDERDRFLKESHANKIFCRPLWTLLNELPMYRSMPSDGVPVSKEIQARMINLPSGVRENA